MAYNQRQGQGQNQQAAFHAQQDQLFDNVQGGLRDKTHLIQLYTDDPEEAPRLISQPHANGIPLMVIVNDPCCCYHKVNIPNGVYSLEQSWGVD